MLYFFLNLRNRPILINATCLYLEKEKLSHCLEAVVAAVDKIAHEYVVGVGRVAAGAEQLLQVVVLPVDVAADGHGRVNGLHVRLLDQVLEDEVAELLELVLRQVLAVLGELDPFVEVDIAATGRRGNWRVDWVCGLFGHGDFCCFCCCCC